MLSQKDKKLIWFAAFLIATCYLVDRAADLIMEYPPGADGNQNETTHIPLRTLAQACAVSSSRQRPVEGDAGGKFFLEEISLSQVKQARLYPTGNDLNWISPESGIPWTEVRLTELGTLRSELTSGKVHPVDVALYDCHGQDLPDDLRIECEAGQYLWGTYFWELHLEKLDFPLQNILLQITFLDEREAIIQLLKFSTGAIFVARDESTGVEGLVRGDTPVLNSLLATARATPLPVLWPELSATEANELAVWLWGNAYQRTLEYIQANSFITDQVGKVLEVRPAIGQNQAAAWSIGNIPEAVFTVQIIGEVKSAAATVHAKVFTHENFGSAIAFQGSADSPSVIDGILFIPGESRMNSATFRAGLGSYPPVTFKYDIGIVLRLRHLIVNRYCTLLGR